MPRTRMRALSKISFPADMILMDGSGIQKRNGLNNHIYFYGMTKSKKRFFLEGESVLAFFRAHLPAMGRTEGLLPGLARNRRDSGR